MVTTRNYTLLSEAGDLTAPETVNGVPTGQESSQQGAVDEDTVMQSSEEAGSSTSGIAANVASTPLVNVPESFSPYAAVVMLTDQRRTKLNLLTRLVLSGATDISSIKDVQHEIDCLSGLIETYNRSLGDQSPMLNEAKVPTTAVIDEKKVGLPLKRYDIPKFQLRGHSVLPFPKEDAYDNVEHFLCQFEKVLHSAIIDIEVNWRFYVPLSFAYDHESWWREELLPLNKTWSDAREAIKLKFGNTQNMVNARKKVMAMRMTSSETINDFATRYVKAIKEAPNYTVNDQILADNFLYGGIPRELHANLTTVMATMKSSINAAWTVEEIRRVAVNVYGDQILGKMYPDVVFEGDEHRKAPRLLSVSTAIKRKASGDHFCPRHGGKMANHNEQDCYSVGKSEAGPSNGGRVNTFLGARNVPHKNSLCNYCNAKWFHGHQCEEYRRAKGIKTMGKKFNILSIRQRNEAKKNDEEDTDEGEMDTTYECKYFTESKKDINPYQLITPIILEGDKKLPIKLLAMIDTGSDTTILNKSIFFNKLKLNHIHPVEGSLSFMSKEVARIGTTDPIKVTYLNGISFEHTFEVANFNSDMSKSFHILLGTDILSKLNISLTGVAHKYAESDDDSDSELKKKENDQFENLNFDTKRKYNPDNADFGTKEEREAFLQEIKNAVQTNQKIEPGSFCTIPESIVTIPVKENVNYYTKQYPLPYHALPEIKKQLAEWLESGVVAESMKPSSRFNTPLLAVPKKDNNGKLTKHRICMDLRNINRHMGISQENYAVPHIQDIFDRVSKEGHVFSKLDLQSAYHSFQVHPDSREVLSFTVDNKTYHWKGCCFGLQQITSQFCKIMNMIFHDMDGVECYVDDICLFSKAEDHATLVKNVIERLTAVNLKINVEKSLYLKSSILILGFLVGPGIRKIDTRRLSMMDQWDQPPKTSKQIKSICGVISYLRQYIPTLSRLMGPIDYLRNEKNIKDKWTQMHTDRLQTIKEALMTEGLLHTPDMSKPFYLETDASQYGIACALTQRAVDGRTLHIALLSKSLNRAQRNYSVTRRELMAITVFLEKLRVLLWGHPNITVRTDHRALVYLHTMKYPNRAMQNYMDILQEFSQIRYEHLPGYTNTLPDLLSRLYEPFADDQILERGDDTGKKVIKSERLHLSNKKLQSGPKDNKRIHFVTRSKKIYSYDKKLNALAAKMKDAGNEPVEMMAPPIEERKSLLKEVHALGHFGSYSIVKHLHSQGIHWTKLFDEAREVCKSCIQCARHNVQRKGYHPIKNIVAYAPFDRIAMDLAGPFEMTYSGNVFILVVIDICTRYVIARAMPNKQSDTVAYTLIDIFGDYGFPTCIQSDNGRELKNTIMKTITDTLGIEHRFSTPYHSRSNGACENAVKTVQEAVKKMTGFDKKNWDRQLSSAQFSINAKIRHRTESSSFSLMFARQLNVLQKYNQPDKKKNWPNRAMTEKELLEKAKYMSNIVFPAIKDRTLRIIEEEAKRFNKKNYMIHIKNGDWVMVKIPESQRGNKLQPIYEGPYRVAHRNKNDSTYVLKDEMNELLHREYAPYELKVVSVDETAIEDEMYEVDCIRDHRGPPMNREYLVKWSGYGERENTWETEASFNNPLTITKYWDKVKELEQLEQERRAKLFAAGPGSKKEVNKHVEKTRRKRALDNKKATQKRSKRLNTGL
jgi:IS30 family transposase